METLNDLILKNSLYYNLFNKSQYRFTTCDPTTQDTTHHFAMRSMPSQHIKPDNTGKYPDAPHEHATYHGLTTSGRITMSETTPLVAKWVGPRYHIFPSTHADLDSLGTLVNLLTSSDKSIKERHTVLYSLREAFGPTPVPERYHYEITGYGHPNAPYDHASAGPLSAPLQLRGSQVKKMLIKVYKQGGILYINGKKMKTAREEYKSIEESKYDHTTIYTRNRHQIYKQKRTFTATGKLRWRTPPPSPNTRIATPSMSPRPIRSDERARSSLVHPDRTTRLNSGKYQKTKFRPIWRYDFGPWQP